VLPFTDGVEALWNRAGLPRLVQPLAQWVGTNILHNNPGDPSLYDSRYHVALIVTLTFIAAVVTAIWTALGRRRAHPTLYKWLVAYLRFTLGLLMVDYGVIKIWQQQFRVPPRTFWLFTPYGAFTPFMVMTAFMGTSAFYQVVTGVVELLAGVFVMLRRTALLGALLSVAAMANVVMLNYGFRFGVTLFSAHILAIALFIVAPTARRLFAFIVLHRPVAPRVPEPITSHPTGKWIASALGVLYLALAVGINMRSGYVDYRDERRAMVQGVLSGAYDVESFILNGDTLPPLLTDTTRWQRLMVQRDGASGAVWVQPMQVFPQPLRFTTAVEIDTVGRTFTFVWNATRVRWTYTQPDTDRVRLAGPHFVPANAQTRTRARELDDSVSITLRRIELSTLPLLRPVPWITRP